MKISDGDARPYKASNLRTETTAPSRSIIRPFLLVLILLLLLLYLCFSQHPDDDDAAILGYAALSCRRNRVHCGDGCDGRGNDDGDGVATRGAAGAADQLLDGAHGGAGVSFLGKAPPGSEPICGQFCAAADAEMPCEIQLVMRTAFSRAVRESIHHKKKRRPNESLRHEAASA